MRRPDPAGRGPHASPAADEPDEPEDAILTDRYLEALLAAAERRAADVPADADLDPDVRLAAAALRRDLARVHPSFRFEERLAGRLVDLAGDLDRRDRRARGAAAAAVFELEPNATRVVGPLVPVELVDIDVDDADGPRVGLRDGRNRALPILIGGAMASAALSVAGAAVFAWSRRRPPAGALVAIAGPSRRRRLPLPRVVARPWPGGTA